LYKRGVFDEQVLTLVKEIRMKQPRIGVRKLMKLLSNNIGEQMIGRDAVFDLLREHDLLVRKRKTRVVTTQSHHWLRKYPNLIAGFTPNAPHQLWVSDITYIRTAERFIYLFLITDAYSRKIVGWHLSETMEAGNALKALYMAVSQLPVNTKRLIHHSDRGLQYCSSKYVSYLQKNEIRISMTENGDPYENSIAERINGILKTEWLYDIPLKNTAHAQKVIGSVIDIYNCERPHLSIEMLSPNQAHTTKGTLKRLWKSYKRWEKYEMNYL